MQANVKGIFFYIMQVVISLESSSHKINLALDRLNKSPVCGSMLSSINFDWEICQKMSVGAGVTHFSFKVLQMKVTVIQPVEFNHNGAYNGGKHISHSLHQ